MTEGSRLDGKFRQMPPNFQIRALSAGLAGHFLILTFMMLNLRPIADDYCLAVLSRNGLIPGVLEYWHTWSGDVAVVAINVGLVGWPIMNLPFFAASAIPFFITQISIFVCFYLIIRGLVQENRKKNFLLFSTALASSSWLSFWWLNGMLLLPTPLSREIFRYQAEAVTSWQNINGAYVLPVVLLACGVALVSLKPNSGWFLRLSWSVIFGAFIGFSGYPLALTVIFASSSLLVFVNLRESRPERLKNSLSISIFMITILVCALASYFSPGASARKEALANLTETKVFDFWNLIKWSLGPAISENAYFVFSIGTIFTITVGFVIAGFTKLQESKRIVTLQLSIIFLALSFILSVSVKASEYFSYVAYWHNIQSGFLVYVSGTLFGFYCGSKKLTPGTFRGRLNSALAYVVVSVILIVSAFLAVHIFNRQLAWERGPAPLVGIEDIQNPTGWQKQCWSQITSLRGTPSR